MKSYQSFFESSRHHVSTRQGKKILQTNHAVALKQEHDVSQQVAVGRFLDEREAQIPEEDLSSGPLYTNDQTPNESIPRQINKDPGSRLRHLSKMEASSSVYFGDQLQSERMHPTRPAFRRS